VNVTPMPRAPGPRLGTSLLVTGAGLLIGIVAVVAIVIPLVGSFTSPVYPAPGNIRVHLKHAKYTVYQRTGTRSGLRSSTLDPPAVALEPGSVSVTAPDGLSIPVLDDPDTETLTRGSAIYSGTLVFEPPVAGEYDLAFNNPVPTNVVVARSLGDAIRSVAGWFGVGALGGAVMVTGVVMWIVGATRRGRARRAMYPGWGPPTGPPGYGPGPPQWGPPPTQPPGYPPPGYPPSPPPGYPPPPPNS
jgi:hypothetical protein